MHCKPVPPAGAAKRGLRAAITTAMKVAGQVAQASAIAGDVVEAAEADSSAMSAALGMRAGMAAAQMKLVKGLKKKKKPSPEGKVGCGCP